SRVLEPRPQGVEGSDVVPQASLDLVLKHVPGTRAPLSGEHPWHALVEGTTAAPAVDIVAELQSLREAALRQGIIGDAVIRANEAQTEAFWKLRDTISEAE